MFICAELDSLGQCAEWVSVAEAWGVEPGTGVQIGFLFLGLVAAAWGAQQIARLVLNR